MEKQFTASKSITLHVPSAKVWHALTDPETIKQYFFGTSAHSDWEVGKPITFTGTWEGKPYEDKGTILKNIPGKLLQYTYWSSMSGKEDKPENYAIITYELKPGENQTTLTVTQSNIRTSEQRDHSEANWGKVLEDLKKLLET